MIEPQGINLALRLEWLIVPRTGHETLVPDKLGKKQSTQKQDSHNLPGKCSWLLVPEAEGEQRVLCSMCTGGSETAQK